MSGDMPSESLESNSEHAYFMKQALLMGEKALETGETPVGCVLVYDKKIVGFGMNDTNKSMNVVPFKADQTVFVKSEPIAGLLRVQDMPSLLPSKKCLRLILGQRCVRQTSMFGGTGSILSLHAEFVLAFPWTYTPDAKLIYASRSIDPSYPVQGGLFHKEAIMLLRRFYIQENEKGRKSSLHPLHPEQGQLVLGRTATQSRKLKAAKHLRSRVEAIEVKSSGGELKNMFHLNFALLQELNVQYRARANETSTRRSFYHH
ncbi:uncharacterized protein BO96DRAFT_385578 [Aspergillus niger CBS 101883]|uniref:Contig An14c0010, genomic contig n=2 Tax=Aspergillus niger TaxID=5061 RepID=A2R2A4_ASPNC|nr:uncharacterized protein BO96DRAFT_385578 [Aspergillus niger CBS 101883]XP_059602215.1 uncharacterized protein An14g00050 [Aspergillus niger]PYH60909.1 hypothetical protein BO96DRAFT_385578 [Aspergillus niger CBS 101883]CAK41804.1 unnamed protein product [Aspergillus niger]